MIDTTPSCFFEIYDEEAYKGFIKATEKIFRTSPEYSAWLATTGNEKCAVTGISKDSLEIQVHHFGETLWDIMVDILTPFIDAKLNVSSFYTCLILADLHLNGCVTYIPVTYDIHKMLHKDEALAYQKYPDLDKHVTYGNMELKKQIINKWFNRFKNNFESAK